jgi:hypothetical protein
VLKTPGGQGTGVAVPWAAADMTVFNATVMLLFKTFCACAGRLSKRSPVAGTPCCARRRLQWPRPRGRSFTQGGRRARRAALRAPRATATAIRALDRRPRARGNCCSRCRTRPVGTGTLGCAPRSMLLVSWAQSPGLVLCLRCALVYTTAGSTSDQTFSDQVQCDPAGRRPRRTQGCAPVPRWLSDLTCSSSKGTPALPTMSAQSSVSSKSPTSGAVRAGWDLVTCHQQVGQLRVRQPSSGAAWRAALPVKRVALQEQVLQERGAREAGRGDSWLAAGRLSGCIASVSGNEAKGSTRRAMILEADSSQSPQMAATVLTDWVSTDGDM